MIKIDELMDALKKRDEDKNKKQMGRRPEGTCSFLVNHQQISIPPSQVHRALKEGILM